MQQCEDGKCRVQSSICMLDFHCTPSICACVVGNHLNHSTDYCRHQCPPGICTCAPLMFQCSAGGCIPYWCFDFMCPYGVCLDMQFVNDLIPDCTGAEDELHSLSIKYGGLNFPCEHLYDIPCVPGHSKCFGINNLCVYDHDSFGHISHCRDGAHLQNCNYIKCTNTFKCPNS